LAEASAGRPFVATYALGLGRAGTNLRQEECMSNELEILRLKNEVHELGRKDRLGLDDLERAGELADKVASVSEKRAAERREGDRRAMKAQLRSLGNFGDDIVGEYGGGLWAAITTQRFDFKQNSRVTVPVDQALGIRLKSGSFDGTIGEDTLPSIVLAPDLGFDARFLFPRVPTIAVDDGVAHLASYRQQSRSLASPSDMIRAIDATDSPAKPETNTQSEVTALALSQVATVSTGIPAILFANAGFRGWVQNDVELAWRTAIDAMIVAAITAASPPSPSGSPANEYENVPYAEETVRAAGYNPNLVVMSPGDALALQLQQLTGGDTYVFGQVRPTVVVTSAVGDGDGFVMDAAAALTLYASPTRFEVFVENAGQTNSFTARYENHSGAQIHRVDAICMLAGGS
jgi:hypothetical protein